MTVTCSTLTDYVPKAQSLTMDAFADEHPGAYLVAMGVIEVEITGGETASTFEINNPFDMPKHSTGDAPLAGHVFNITTSGDDELVSLGREAVADIMVPDGSVSGLHAQLRLLSGGAQVVVKDLGSKNGTSINNEPIQSHAEAEVADGDLLTVGRFSFQMFGPRTFHAALRILG